MAVPSFWLPSPMVCGKAGSNATLVGVSGLLVGVVSAVESNILRRYMWE
jgi:hypothetical protein